MACEYYLVVMLVYLGTDLLAVWGLNLEFGVSGVANLAYIVVVAAGASTFGGCTRGPSGDSTWSSACPGSPTWRTSWWWRRAHTRSPSAPSGRPPATGDSKRTS